ncbi:hypothetical protein PHJA_001750900 [Phtheirospermum japonicum]|uniref:TPX2 C-terminal domain-containing protein n=1 Tax=Phtheirospermum japonicum TaxID=374723 RepID=A0A830CG92_9LAMI|nr:hypothetical protein PHJA_001750900 [Phtheirospermum japonicum]
MGESSACLVRSFSLSSPTYSEEKKGENTLQRALTTSVSFGRFMSDSLDWEKWSAFTQNRHLEEVERYSKPGSVAEKKAYFEAHFKRRRAAALLEQQNAAANNDLSETNTENKVDDNPSSELDPVIENTKDEEVQINVPVFPVGQNDSHDDPIEKVIESPVLTESPVDLTTKHPENDDEHKDDSIKRNSESLSEKDPEVSSKCVSPVKPIMPSQIKNSVNKTPNSRKIYVESSNKRRSYITSLHTSISFASSSQKSATSPGLPKIVANPRLVRAPAKKYKNNTVPQTSTRASVSSMFKHNSAAPPAENKRAVTRQGDSNAVRKTVDSKVHSQSSDFSKSINTSEGKARLPTTSSPFTFKSEERAAKRKEASRISSHFYIKTKLEQKSKSKETEKHELLAKSQVNKSRSNFKDLRNSVVSRATENTEVPPRIKLPSSSMKKIPTERQCFPKIVEKDNNSRPPWSVSAKTEGLKDVSGKNRRPSGKCFSKKTNENASPNIRV